MTTPAPKCKNCGCELELLSSGNGVVHTDPQCIRHLASRLSAIEAHPALSVPPAERKLARGWQRSPHGHFLCDSESHGEEDVKIGACGFVREGRLPGEVDRWYCAGCAAEMGVFSPAPAAPAVEPAPAVPLVYGSTNVRVEPAPVEKPSKVEAPRRKDWCGTRDCGEVTGDNFPSDDGGPGLTYWCSSRCRDAGRPLNPAPEPASGADGAKVESSGGFTVTDSTTGDFGGMNPDDIAVEARPGSDVNKGAVGVHVCHIPSGHHVTVTELGSAHANRREAMRRLRILVEPTDAPARDGEAVGHTWSPSYLDVVRRLRETLTERDSARDELATARADCYAQQTARNAAEAELATARKRVQALGECLAETSETVHRLQAELAFVNDSLDAAKRNGATLSAEMDKLRAELATEREHGTLAAQAQTERIAGLLAELATARATEKAQGEKIAALEEEVGQYRDVFAAMEPEGDPVELKCGACTRGNHADCSGWCFCRMGCRDRHRPAQPAQSPAPTGNREVDVRTVFAGHFLSTPVLERLLTLIADVERAAEQRGGATALDRPEFKAWRELSANERDNALKSHSSDWWHVGKWALAALSGDGEAGR